MPAQRPAPVSARTNNPSRAGAEQLDAADPLSGFRERFSPPTGPPYYLNGNSLGRPSQKTLAAVESASREWAATLVQGWERWLGMPAAVGDRIGRLLGAAPAQVLACDNTTVNLYKLIRAGVAARPGRTKLVGLADDFPTDRYVLEGVAAEAGLELTAVQVDPVEGPRLDDVTTAIDADTALVCVSHVHYRSGTRLDMEALTSSAHEQGALVLWDLCHSAGALPVTLDRAGADLAVGCTYKYLNSGPGGPGFLYVNRCLHDSVRQPVWGWFGQRDQFAMGPTYEPAPGVQRFLTGTPSVLGLHAVDAALADLEEAGIDRLWAKSQQMIAYLADLVRDLLEPLGARLASPSDPRRRGAHLAVSHPDAERWSSTLVARQLVICDFRPPDVVRIAPAPLYTRFVDLFEAVSLMAGVLGGELRRVPERSGDA